jgi:hypothetical protein
MSDGLEPEAGGAAKGQGRRLRPRLVITGLISLALLVSALVFAQNLIYLQLRTALASFSSSSGLGMDADLLLALLLLFVLALGMMNEKRLFLSLIAAWILLVPSLLYFSALDWMKALNLVYDFHDMANRLPNYVIFLNGALLVATGLLLRSHAHVDGVWENLLRRGASPDQVRSAVGRNLAFLYKMIAISTLGCMVVAGLVILIAPAFSALFDGSEIAYVVVSVVTGVFLVAVLGSFILLAARRTPQAGALDGDEER